MKKFIFSLVVFFMVEAIQAQPKVELPENIYDKTITYNPNSLKPLRLLMDYYHHKLPSTRVGNHLITGSWSDDNGRYGWDDFVHSNTFDPLFTALSKEHIITMSREPYSKELLSGTDAVLIFNPDNPYLIPGAKVLSDGEISLLQQFVKNGGSLMVMINANGLGREHETFENVQLRKLTRNFGLDWNENDTHYSDNIISETHPYFYDIPIFHYGAGCTIKLLPEAQQPQVLLNVYSDAGYPDRKVSGPGIVMVKSGKGKFILVGDVGSWTGNISRPWAENERMLLQLFQYMKPDRGVKAAEFQPGKTLQYEVTASGLQAIPVANSISSIARPGYRKFSPRPQTGMPYFETSGIIELTGRGKSTDNSSKLEAKIKNFRWFDEEPRNRNDQYVRFTVSQQGKTSQMEPEGYDAQWLSPDMSALIALLPVEGIRPGDRWESIESLRIPILKGNELSPVRMVNMNMEYVEDVKSGGKDCRLIRSSGHIWLDELGIRIEDILPAEEIRRVGGEQYELFTKHGGRILYKREQWVDQKTGIVLNAKIQIRIIAWIKDKRKEVQKSNADKDNNMIVSLAHIVNFSLKN